MRRSLFFSASLAEKEAFWFKHGFFSVFWTKTSLKRLETYLSCGQKVILSCFAVVQVEWEVVPGYRGLAERRFRANTGLHTDCVSVLKGILQHGGRFLKLTESNTQKIQWAEGTYRVGLQSQANFSAPTFEPAHETRAGKHAALSVYLSQLQLRCSNLITGPQASSSRSSPLSQQRRTCLLFAEQIEIFQVKYWLDTFKARNANLKFLDDRRKKKQKKQPDWPAEGAHVCLRRSFVDLLSRVRCRSLSKSVVFAFFKIVAFKRSFLLFTKFACCFFFFD